jgi:hypothetical protein
MVGLCDVGDLSRFIETSAIDEESGADSADLDAGLDGEDGLLGLLFPTSLEEAYAGRDARTIQDLGEIGNGPLENSHSEVGRDVDPYAEKADTVQYMPLRSGITVGGRKSVTSKQCLAVYARTTAVLLLTLGLSTWLSTLAS